jgi:hypothetical protein
MAKCEHQLLPAIGASWEKEDVSHAAVITLLTLVAQNV